LPDPARWWVHRAAEVRVRPVVPLRFQAAASCPTNIAAPAFLPPQAARPCAVLHRFDFSECPAGAGELPDFRVRSDGDITTVTPPKNRHALANPATTVGQTAIWPRGQAAAAPAPSGLSSIFRLHSVREIRKRSAPGQ